MTRNPPRLDGDVVVVIGGSSGIGLATSVLAAHEGANVVIVGRDSNRLQTAIAAIAGNVRAVSTDIGSPTAVQGLFESLGEVDHIAITAADLVEGQLDSSNWDDLSAFVAGRLWGPLYVARSARWKQGPGSLTLVSGSAGRRPVRGRGMSQAIAGAIEPLARALAVELAPIRVNVVCPGTISTPRTERSHGGPEGAAEYLRRRAAQLPVGRAGRPEDIAEAILFFMTNTYTTGSVLVIDGGASLI